MNKIDLAIVHHANQYLITNGYQNREGLEDVLGIHGDRKGYLEIFELHKAYRIPFHLHLSGTLLESILWHYPDFFLHLEDLKRLGLLDLVASSYGQNIMRFFRYQHNFRQLNEELMLYREHLKAQPQSLKVFWPPERLWDTEKLAPVITDKGLLNGGYEYVLVDDRLYYPSGRGAPSRKDLDRGRKRSFMDYYPCRIIGGEGLTALPISSHLRQHIPPRNKAALKDLERFFHWLADKNSQVECPLIAIYGDDLEKSAGCCGWDEKGPVQYEAMLRWLSKNRWVRAVKLSDWVSEHCDICQKSLEVGSYFEMSKGFGAGEDYEKWYRDPKWNKYRKYFSWAEDRVIDVTGKGADPALIELSWKHLLVSAWETAWHTPSSGVHGDANSSNKPSPWAKAIASHSRHSAVIAGAAYWMKNKKGKAYAYLDDIDNDGYEELILKNDRFFAVFSPLRGGRLVYLFDISGTQGKMVIGNPGDDWNWQEELNQEMKTPANHPGALSDIGYEDDLYAATIVKADGDKAEALLTNKRRKSPAFGLQKKLRLVRGGQEIEVTYQLPEELPSLLVGFGFSPDYLHLLRFGRRSLRAFGSFTIRGYSNNGVSVWVRISDSKKAVYDSYATPLEFGHGYAMKVRGSNNSFTLWIGTGKRKSRVVSR